MKWIVFCLLGMLMLAQGQAVSQKLLATEEQPASFLQNETVKPVVLIQDRQACADTGCDVSLTSNHVCNSECNNAECAYDGYDCGGSFW